MFCLPGLPAPPNQMPPILLSSCRVILIVLLTLSSVLTSCRQETDCGISKARADIKALKICLISYRETSGGYHTTGQGLRALVDRPTVAPIPIEWTPKLKDETALVDPWERPFHYRYPGIRNSEGPDLWSIGKDGKTGTADDYSNYHER